MPCSFCLATEVVCRDFVSLPDLSALQEGCEASGFPLGTPADTSLPAFRVPQAMTDGAAGAGVGAEGGSETG